MADVFGALFGNKEEEKNKEVQQPRPLRITFDRGTATPGSHHKSVSYGLTPLGKQKISSLDETDARFQVLACIQENGPSSTGEISDRVHLSHAKVQYIIDSKDGLMRAGCLKPVGMGGE